ncbi:MAG: YfhO family protein [Candidatus Hydrothermia bacterium]
MGNDKKVVKKPQKEASIKTLMLKPYIVFLVYLVLTLFVLGPFLSPSKNLMGTDWFNGGYANWAFMRDYIKENGRLALWNIYIFSGMPTIGAFFPEILTLRFLSTFLIPIHAAHALGFILLLLVASLSMYFLLVELYGENLSAFLGGLFYGFSAVLVSTAYAGHLGRLTSMALFPLYVGLLKKGIDSGKLKWFILMGASVGISFLNGHPQMSYYGVLFLVAFFIFYNLNVGNNLKSQKFYKYLAFSIIGAVVAVLIYSFYLLPVFENLPYTARGAERGYEYAVSWSMPPEEILNLLTPRFSGILDEYWGRSYFKLHSEYMGIITLVLALLSIVYKFKNDRLVRFLTIYSIFVLLYVFGGYTPFFKVYYYILPMVKKFRAPNLMFFVFNFINVLLAVSLLRDAIKGDLDLKRFKRSVLYVLGSLVGLFLIFVIFKSGFINLFSGLLKRAKEVTNPQGRMYLLEDNYNSFISMFFVSLIFGSVGVLLTYFILTKKEARLTLISLALVSFLDLYLVDKNFVVDAGKSVDEMYGSDEIINEIKKDSGLFRVFPLMYPRANDGTLMIHRIQSIGGYTSSPPRRYQEFIGAGESVMFNPQNLLEKPSLLNLLDVKYVIAYNFDAIDTTRFDENTRAVVRKWKEYLSYFELWKPLGQFALYKNNNNFGRVFFVNHYKVVKDPKEALDHVISLPVDSLRKMVILEKDPGVLDSLKYDSLENNVNIEVEKYDANEIILHVNLPGPGFLVFSENYHPAWKCYVDGKMTEVLVANYAFRACYLPEGSHVVKMKFDSVYHKMGFILCFLGFLVSATALAFVFKKE